MREADLSELIADPVTCQRLCGALYAGARARFLSGCDKLVREGAMAQLTPEEHCLVAIAAGAPFEPTLDEDGSVQLRTTSPVSLSFVATPAGLSVVMNIQAS